MMKYKDVSYHDAQASMQSRLSARDYAGDIGKKNATDKRKVYIFKSLTDM